MMARITMDDVGALARGCAVLGTGGGGDVRTAAIAARRTISAYGEVPLVSLEELDPDALVLPLSGIGAPTVSHEMIAAAEEIGRAHV